MLKKIEKIAKFLIISALTGLLVTMLMPDMARSADVTAWATVGSIYTCTPDNTAVSFGTVDNTKVYAASASTTMTITTNDVIYLQAYDAGKAAGEPGLYCSTTTPPKVIGSASDAFADTATLVANTEGYGLRAATTSAGSNNTLNLSFRYGISNQTVNVYYVGGLEQGSANDVGVASTSAGITTGRVVELGYYVAVASNTPAADYVDTITYTCTTTP